MQRLCGRRPWGMRKAKGLVACEKRLARTRLCKGDDWSAPPRLLPSGFPAHVTRLDAESGLLGSAK